jgi:hypothetical protein
MSKLEEYVENIKKYIAQNEGLTETEIIRYVYLDLGKRFSFDLKFSFGNRSTQKKIYSKGKEKEELEEVMETNIGICKSISYILEYILKKLDVNIITVAISEPYNERDCPHIYNVVIESDGKKYVIDLQEDLENIQSHSFTENFGLSVNHNDPPVMSRFFIEQMDRKLGYIDDKNYYANDYLYLMKSDIGLFSDLSEKAEFVLENIDIYENPNMQYAERKWHHEKLLMDLFSKDELKKIHQIDCYKEQEQVREYINTIYVENKGKVDVYIYSVEENRYCKMTLEEFTKLTLNGVTTLQGIPGLRGTLKRLKEEEKKEER